MDALRRWLVDFDLDLPAARPAAPAWLLAGRDPPPRPSDAPLAAPAPDAVDRAVSAARAEAAEALAAALAERDALHADRLAVERARWAAEQGAALADAFRRAHEATEAALAEAAAAALEPLLGEALGAAAGAELGRAVAELLASGAGGAVAATGPEDLLAALRSALAGRGVDAGAMTFTASEAVEVTVTADSSTIATRFGDWTRALRRRLEDAA